MNPPEPYSASPGNAPSVRLQPFSLSETAQSLRAQAEALKNEGNRLLATANLLEPTTAPKGVSAPAQSLAPSPETEKPAPKFCVGQMVKIPVYARNGTRTDNAWGSIEIVRPMNSRDVASGRWFLYRVSVEVGLIHFEAYFPEGRLLDWNPVLKSQVRPERSYSRFSVGDRVSIDGTRQVGRVSFCQWSYGLNRFQYCLDEASYIWDEDELSPAPEKIVKPEAAKPKVTKPKAAKPKFKKGDNVIWAAAEHVIRYVAGHRKGDEFEYVLVGRPTHSAKKPSEPCPSLEEIRKIVVARFKSGIKTNISDLALSDPPYRELREKLEKSVDLKIDEEGSVGLSEWGSMPYPAKEIPSSEAKP